MALSSFGEQQFSMGLDDSYMLLYWGDVVAVS